MLRVVPHIRFYIAPAMLIPLGFAGGLHDRDVGWGRFGYRDYDPMTARFTAPDPIGYAGGDNDLYGYCLDDPVNGIDPQGLSGDKVRTPYQGNGKDGGIDSLSRARKNSCPNGVWQYKRPADIAFGLVDHTWLKTNNKEAGMNNAEGGVPGDASDSPFFTDAAVIDHTGQSDWPESKGECIPDANAAIVDQELELGRPLGKWTPGNNCKAHAFNTLKKAGHKVGYRSK